MGSKTSLSTQKTHLYIILEMQYDVAYTLSIYLCGQNLNRESAAVVHVAQKRWLSHVFASIALEKTPASSNGIIAHLEAEAAASLKEQSEDSEPADDAQGEEEEVEEEEEEEDEEDSEEDVRMFLHFLPELTLLTR
jgi:hypothetical protein